MPAPAELRSSASVFKSTNGGGNWTLLGGGLQRRVIVHGC